MKSSSLFLVCLCALFLSSCKEDFECSSANTVPIPQNMKDYFYFKPGSWWVYYNTKTHQHDSLWVDNSSITSVKGNGPKEGFGNPNKCFEQTFYFINSKSSLSYSTSIYNESDEGEEFFFTWQRQDRQDYLGLPFLNNVVTNKYPYYMVQEIDSLPLHGKTYHYILGTQELPGVKYLLFAKNIGLINI